MDYLTPEDINQFDTQSNSLRTQYGRQTARNTFDQTNANLDYGLAQSALTQQWGQNRQALPGGYVNRGLANSGIYQRGLNDYASQRQMAFDGLRRQYDTKIGGLNLDQQDYESTLNSGLNDVESAKNARRDTLAAQLRGMQP